MLARGMQRARENEEGIARTIALSRWEEEMKYVSMILEGHETKLILGKAQLVDGGADGGQTQG